MSPQERRRFQRIPDDSLSLKLDGFDAVTHTLNISESGLYCKLDHEIPLMSRLKLILMIPDVAGGKPKNLAVEGVVVREHPVIIDGKIKHYDAAIFFDSLSDRDRDVIAGYIAHKRG